MSQEKTDQLSTTAGGIAAFPVDAVDYLTYDEESQTMDVTNTDVEARTAGHWESKLPKEESKLGRGCIEYLLLDEFDQGPCQSLDELRERTSNRLFLSYAISSCLCHYAQEYASDDLESLAVMLLRPPQRLAAATQIVLWHKRTLNEIEQDFQEILTKCQEKSCPPGHVQVRPGKDRNGPGRTRYPPNE